MTILAPSTIKPESRATVEELEPILDHWAKAAHFSHEAFLELAMALEHVRRVLPQDYEAVAALLTGAFQNWQFLEEAGDEILGAQIVDLLPTDKPLPELTGGE